MTKKRGLLLAIWLFALDKRLGGWCSVRARALLIPVDWICCPFSPNEGSKKKPFAFWNRAQQWLIGARKSFTCSVSGESLPL